VNEPRRRPRAIALGAAVVLAALGLVALRGARGPAAAHPYAMGADGLPEIIPPPGSPAPSEAEWAAVPREVLVTGRPPLPCEAKMLREWLRVRCRAGRGGTPKATGTIVSAGHEEHLGVADEVATVEVQVVRGAGFQGRVVYAAGRTPAAFSIVVAWPEREPRPSLSYADDSLDDP
jgi:hypothetical protein